MGFTDDNIYSDVPEFYDKFGKLYLISEDDYKRAIEQRSSSRKKEIERIIAKRLLESKFHRLTEPQKHVLDGRILGHSFLQISQSLGISKSSTIQHFKAAQKKIKDYINNNRKSIEENEEILE